MLNYTVNPILDVTDSNKYNTVGILTGVSSNANKPVAEFTIKIDNKTYRVPKALVSHNVLKKGSKYKIYYYKNSRLVYNITMLEDKGTA